MYKLVTMFKTNVGECRNQPFITNMDAQSALATTHAILTKMVLANTWIYKPKAKTSRGILAGASSQT